MMRALMYLIATVFLITVVRAIIGVIFKGFGEAVEASRTPGKAAAEAPGELKKDPICGTFVPAATSVKKTVGSQTFHFCSSGCRDKFHA